MQSNHAPGDFETGRLDSLLEDGVLTLDLVSAPAGDRPLTECEKVLLADLKKSRCGEFFPSLLYAITHECCPPALAEDLWNEILRHKTELSEAVRRNVGIAVAALDMEGLLP